MIDPITVERIKGAADIVEVVGDYVHLVRRGANYMGLCPFHNERTPSFSVNKQRNFCYCFSCKKGGSPVNFIMEKEGLSYHEALLHLARRYGIEVEERELTDEEKARRSERESMFVANEWAMKQMESDMYDTDEGCDVGLQYFSQRGVTDAALKAFHLGYALDKGNYLVTKAIQSGFEIEIFKKLGLIGTSQKGVDYDRFRGRVIFPILNSSGKVIAFGGRDLKGGMAKYINSPESELYKKSNELYGIFQAKSSIVKDDKCYLVEGYMDVIGMWQSGMKNVVASSGTALTDGQIAMIHRFTQNITLIYDGDAAGIKASLRGIDMLLSHRLNVKVMLLPDGEDPDSFARKNTPEQFRQYVAEHETDVIRYKARVLLGDTTGDPRKRIEAVNSVVQSIAHIPDQVSRDIYVQECADILGINEETIAKAVGKSRRAIVEAIKRDRTRKEFADASQSNASLGNIRNSEGVNNINKTTNNNDIRIASEGTPINEGKNSLKFPSRFESVEKSVLKYCIRYAFIPFCAYSAENGDEVSLDVLEFVKEELLQSEMTFTVEDYKMVFDKLEILRPAFEKFYAEKEIKIDNEIKALREAGYRKIGESAKSISEIDKAEKALEKELGEKREKELSDLIKDYPVRILGSDENETVRRIVLDLVFEKHQLSKIYQRDSNFESEEDRLQQLVVRALDEWKNEIINERMDSLLAEFRKITGTGDVERERELQSELTTLMNIRTEMAKAIGERILFNHPVESKKKRNAF